MPFSAFYGCFLTPTLIAQQKENLGCVHIELNKKKNK